MSSALNSFQVWPASNVLKADHSSSLSRSAYLPIIDFLSSSFAIPDSFQRSSSKRINRLSPSGFSDENLGASLVPGAGILRSATTLGGVVSLDCEFVDILNFSLRADCLFAFRAD